MLNNKSGRTFLMTLAMACGTASVDFIKTDPSNPIGIGLACLSILAMAVREFVKENSND